MVSRQSVWNGMIPTQVCLFENDIASDIVLDPYHIMLPRISYLTLAAADVIDYFRQDALETTTHIWFEFEGKVLKGHLPIGILFDLYSNQTIPWKITLHFRELKVPQIVKLNSIEEVSKFYYHSTKQGIQLLVGNTRLFTSLSIKKHEQLVESVSTGNASLFENILEELQSVSFIPRAIPLRVVFDGKPLLQRPVRVHRLSPQPNEPNDTQQQQQQQPLSIFSQGKSHSRLEERTRSASRSISAASTEVDPSIAMQLQQQLLVSEQVSESPQLPPPPPQEQQDEEENEQEQRGEAETEEQSENVNRKLSLENNPEIQSTPTAATSTPAATTATITIVEEENEYEFVTLQDIYDELFPNSSISGAPIDDDEKSMRERKFQISLGEAACKGQPCCIASCFCPCCAAYQARTAVLEHDMTKYECCQGYIPGCCCCKPGHMGEKSCPEFCLCLESVCCLGPSMSTSRLYVMDKYNLGYDECDNRMIRFSNCLQILSCICNILAIFISQLRELARLIQCIADLVFYSMMGCMSAQIQYEVEYQKTVHGGGYSGEAVAHPVHDK